MASEHSILLVGESNVGKTHYGAQFLKRLMVKACALKMAPGRAPTNLEPFQKALSSLTEGRATDHTPASTYVESVWPIMDEDGQEADLVWPDYAGEQVRNLVIQRKIPPAWQERVSSASDWVLVLRLNALRTEEDLFSRPLHKLGEENTREQEPGYELSDQARTIELLQILLYLAEHRLARPLRKPSLTILLSCWDELATSELPEALIASSLPMLWAFMRSNWVAPTVIGLSALERPLSKSEADQEYAVRGPEDFGFVILPDGTKQSDITLPIRRLLAAGA